MGLFKKKESIHFERDEEGKVIQVEHNGQPEGTIGYERVGNQGGSVRVHVDPEYKKAKTGRQLEEEYYKKHPEKKHPTFKKIGVGLSKLDKKIVDYNKRGNIMNTKRTYQPKRSSPSFGFNSYGRGNTTPFESMFNMGMPKSKPRTKKKSSKTKYKVIGGKAYPIAGTSKSKSKKKKSTKRKQGLYDPFEAWKW